MKYSVPKHHNEKLISPPFEDLGAAAESNRRRMEGYGFSIGGESFPLFRRRAREEVLSAPQDAPLVLSAHQPGLLHMGVVEKLRLLEKLSRSGRVAHIVLDTDEIDSVAAMIPLLRKGVRGTEEFHLYRSAVPKAIFTIPPPGKQDLDAAFSEIAQGLESTGSESILRSFTRFLEVHDEVYGGASDLGSLLASWCRSFLVLKGLYETTMSSVCRTGAWRDYAGALVDDIDTFSRVYNDCLAVFRQERKIQSPHAPFPDLLRSRARTEIPFWAPGGGGLRIKTFALPDGALVDERGGKVDGSFLMPRAMTLTIFARLFLCDLFIHGAGGGNYDRATDMLIREYYGVEPPSYCVASATVYPDLPMDREIEPKIRRLKETIREMEQHPENYADPATAAPLIEEKKNILSKREGKLDRHPHQRIREIKEELAGGITGLIDDTERELRELDEVARMEKPWRRRDFPYFLFGPAFV